MDASRPSIPAPPPAYSLVRRITFRRPLRPVVLFCIACSFIWCLALGVDYIKAMRNDGNSSRLKTTYLVQAILFFILAVLELSGFYAVWISQIRGGKLYVFFTILGGVVTTAAETIRMALHFVYKSDIISACEAEYANDTIDFDSTQDIADYCSDSWSNGIWRDAAWLIFGIICSLFIFILSKAYYHQLLDPTSTRVAGEAPSDRYRMNAMNAVPYGQDPPFVPPYSADGAPASNAGYGAPPVYDAPAYAPPEKGEFVNSDAKSAPLEETARSDDKDLEAHIEHPGQRYDRSDSEDTIPGRQREGQV